MKIVFRTKSSMAAWDRVVRDDMRSPEPASTPAPTTTPPVNESDTDKEKGNE